MLIDGKALKKLAGCALCCAAAAAAVAGPPSVNSPGGLLNRASGLASGLMAAGAAHKPAGRPDFQGLDLRPPETLAGVRPSAPVEDSAATFPSARRTQFGTPTGSEEDLPGGSSVATLRMENKIQEMERRVPREGLPVARLWETKTALLHVGLSPKGKPGLWLIQKVP